MADPLGYAVIFRSGTRVWGMTADDILQQLRGGWNPEPLVALRLAFARRAGIYDGDVLAKLSQISAESYIDAMAAHEFWTVKRVPADIVARHTYRTADAV